jgi:hypothetical protein
VDRMLSGGEREPFCLTIPEERHATVEWLG